MDIRWIDTVIIGGGQAGLAMSYCLKRQRRRHVVLERAPRVAKCVAQPALGFLHFGHSEFSGAHAGCGISRKRPLRLHTTGRGRQTSDDYVERFSLPVRCAVEVFRVEKNGLTYLVRTNKGNYEAENVVIATGLCQPQKKPNFAEKIPSRVLQIHSMDRTFLLQVGIRP